MKEDKPITMIGDDNKGGSRAPIDYEKLLDERCRGKRDLAARLLLNLAEDSGPRWLIEAEGIVKKGDMAGAARIGHSIKGSCKMVCADNMVSAGIELEKAGKAGSQEWAIKALAELKGAFSEARNWLRQNRELLK